MRIVILFLSFFLLSPDALSAEADPYRTFHDTDGRSIRAVIIQASPTTVWLRRDDDRTFRVPITTFSEADRLFIENWRVMDALHAPNALELAIRRYSDGRDSTETERRRTTFENRGYIVTLRNSTPFDLKDLEIEYRYYVLRDSTYANPLEPDRERYLGRKRIATLPAQGQREFKTPSIQLISSSLRANRTSDQRRVSDELDGIWIRIRYNQEIIAEFSRPSSLMETGDW